LFYREALHRENLLRADRIEDLSMCFGGKIPQKTVSSLRKR